MKFIRKLFFCAALLIVGSASADALYWQVDTSSGGGYTGNTDGAHAALWATTTGSTVADEGVNTMVDGYYSLDDGTKFVTDDLGVYGSSEYSFFVEIINATGSSWTQSAATSYNDLLSAGYISTSPLSVPTAALSGGMNGAAVPEPTSGLLLLIGGALLALRRRR